jgi:hypothetical protein
LRQLSLLPWYRSSSSQEADSIFTHFYKHTTRISSSHPYSHIHSFSHLIWISSRLRSMLRAKRCSSPAINTQIVCRKEKGGRQFETPFECNVYQDLPANQASLLCVRKSEKEKIRKSAQTRPLANACEDKTRNIIVSLTETCQIPPSLAIDERGSHQSTPDERKSMQLTPCLYHFAIF